MSGLSRDRPSSASEKLRRPRAADVVRRGRFFSHTEKSIYEEDELDGGAGSKVRDLKVKDAKVKEKSKSKDKSKDKKDKSKDKDKDKDKDKEKDKNADVDNSDKVKEFQENEER